MSLRSSFLRLAVLAAIVLTAVCTVTILPVSASVFNGGGLLTGVGNASTINGVSTQSPRQFILNLLLVVLSYVNLIGVVVVVVAGLYLIFSNGNEEQKDKAKKIMLYLIIGLLLLLFARLIVVFFTQTINDNL